MLVYLVIAVFILGYTCIIFEHKLGINKATSALVAAAILWALVFQMEEIHTHSHLFFLKSELSGVVQVVLFLLGALAIVEVINAHKGFALVSSFLAIPSKRMFLWVVGFVTFFLSAVLDNLTTTIVMISLIRKVLPHKEDRLIIGSGIVIAANAGGAWTPIGDVTTTMLWIGGQISTAVIMKSLFIPSLVCMVGAFFPLQFLLKGEIHPEAMLKEQKTEPYALLVLILGVSSLIFVPIFKTITGLPPFMGVLFGLGILWLVTDFVHRHDPHRHHLQVAHILRRLDVPSVIFFLGILLAVGALHEAGLLEELANYFDRTFNSPLMIATLIGLFSAVVDNVPLVAAAMGMYDLAAYPMDHTFWRLVAYAAGTGGSLLIIGSAAGVVFMGMEKVDFFDYLKKITLPAAIGFFGGIGAYLLQGYFLGF